MRWTLAVASIVVAVAAQAGDMHPMHPAGQGPDANNDGLVTREEAKSCPRLAESFDAADKNKDGQLDQAELTAHHEAMHGEMRAKGMERWKAADKDGNGSLSRDEAKASMPHLADNFDQIDGNKDGQVSADEMRAFRKAGPHHDGGHMQQKFKAADTNGDGSLDLAEAQTGMPGLAERFSTVDANNDGKITPDELRAARMRLASE